MRWQSYLILVELRENPKGCMISDYSTNAEIWQVGKTMGTSRQECMMAVLPPFVNYSLTNGMLEPLPLE